VECASSTLQKFALSRLLHPWRAPRITLQGPLAPKRRILRLLRSGEGEHVASTVYVHCIAQLALLAFDSRLLFIIETKISLCPGPRSWRCRSGSLPHSLSLSLSLSPRVGSATNTEAISLEENPPPMNHETAKSLQESQPLGTDATIYP
jgi:hypothetical protein